MSTELELRRLRDEVERLTDQIASLRDTIEHDRGRNGPYYDPSWPYWPWWPAPYYPPRPLIYWGTPPEITTGGSWTYRPTPEGISPTLAGSQTVTNQHGAWGTDTALAHYDERTLDYVGAIGPLEVRCEPALPPGTIRIGTATPERDNRFWMTGLSS